MTRRLGAFGLLIALMATSAGAVAATSGGRTEAEATAGPAERTAPVAKQKPLRYEKHDLFIETNATDGDAGLQLNLDDWRWLKLRDPRGKLTLDLHEGPAAWVWPDRAVLRGQRAAVRRGSVQRVQEALPEGQLYVPRAHGRGPRAGRSDSLSHLVPAGPKVTFPTNGAQVDPKGFKVSWEPVTSPAGVKIVSYQVIVNQGGRELSMYLPPSVTSVTIPAEFLKPGAKTGGEVLAREESGNQTITELPSFRTK
jgi:hypothetical protein